MTFRRFCHTIQPGKIFSSRIVRQCIYFFLVEIRNLSGDLSLETFMQFSLRDVFRLHYFFCKVDAFCRTLLLFFYCEKKFEKFGKTFLLSFLFVSSRKISRIQNYKSWKIWNKLLLIS